jgi:serine/threonine-protein phosphatase 5
VFKLFSESFSALPLATLVGKKYLVLHGGLFSDDKITLDDIRKLNRHNQRQPGQSGLMMEMLWTDPQPEPGRGPSKRGVGMQFGPDVTKRFCENNGLEAIIRSHEVRMEGYEEEHGGKCITGNAPSSVLTFLSCELTLDQSFPLLNIATVRKIKGHTSILAPTTSLNFTSSMPYHIPISDQW